MVPPRNAGIFAGDNPPGHRATTGQPLVWAAPPGAAVPV